MPTAIGSGLDIPAYVDSLVKATRKPAADRINHAGTAVTAKLSAVGQVKQSLSTLKSSLQTLMDRADKPVLTATVPAEAGFSAAIADNAVQGLYSVKVEQLATAQKLTSAVYEKGAKPGAGTLQLKAGETALSVTVSATDTLADVAKAINKAADGKGVIASVVKADGGEHLVLSSREPGTDNAVKITGGSGAFADFKMDTKAASDAIVYVDGLKRTLSSNHVDDLVPGVNLSLTQAKGQEFNLEVKADDHALKSDLDAFVKAWNDANTTLKNSSAYRPDALPGLRASPLTGDSLVRSLQQQLRGQVGDNLMALKDIGVSLDKEGRMSVDEAAFKHADPGAVRKVLGHQGGYSSMLKSTLDSQLNTVDGTVTLRERTLNKSIKGYEAQLDALDARMKKLSDLYTRQFTAMEQVITQMQSSAGALDNLLKSMKQA